MSTKHNSFKSFRMKEFPWHGHKKINAKTFLRILKDKDFPAFCRFIVIKPKGMNLQSFAPETWFPSQVEFELNRTGWDIVLKPRQIGMTTMEEIRDLFYALAYPGSRIAIVNIDEKKAMANIKNIRTVYNRLAGVCKKLGLEKMFPELGTNSKNTQTTKTLLQFANGSIIEGISAGASEKTAEKAGRSHAYDRIHATEVAFWTLPEETMAALLDALGEEFHNRVNPPECVIESTPNNAGDYFYKKAKEAEHKEGKFHLHFFKWWNHPFYKAKTLNNKPFKPTTELEQKLVDQGIDKAHILWWLHKLRDTANGNVQKMLREYPIDIDSCFISSGDGIIDGNVYARLKKIIGTPKLETIQNIPIRIYEEYNEGSSYIIAADTAGGGGNDNSVAIVLNEQTMQIAAIAATNTVPEQYFAEFLYSLGERYGWGLLIPENNFGKACPLVLMQKQYPNLWYDEGNIDLAGFHTNAKTRRQMQSVFIEMIRTDDAFEWFDIDLLKEIQELEEKDNGKIQSKYKGKGGKDDRAICLMMALFIWSKRMASGISAKQVSVHYGRERNFKRGELLIG